MSERYINFTSGNASLSAIIHAPTGGQHSKTGVLIIVGGPQYRVGSHRQFVKLSRFLASNGIASMRADTSGMGDSRGDKTVFFQQSNDIDAAIAAFMQHVPQLDNLVLWGLCDAASAILIKLQQPEPRIRGLVLLNPWVRQPQSHAKALIKHYYLKRMLQADFWHKVFSGKFAILSGTRTLLTTWRAAKRTTDTALTAGVTAQNYVAAMLKGAQAFAGAIQFITSGNDLTAQEFIALCQQHPAWHQLLTQSYHNHIALADHTFSCAQWRQQTEQLTLEFVRRLASTKVSYEKLPS